MTEPHSKEMHQMCLEHFNEPMLSFGELVRCIGYGETAQDCYIITRRQRGEVRWNTCVGGYTFLDALKFRGVGGEWDDLKRLDSELEHSGAPREETFRLELRHYDGEHIHKDLDDRAHEIAVQILLEADVKLTEEIKQRAIETTLIGLLAERKLCADIVKSRQNPADANPGADSWAHGYLTATEDIAKAIDEGGHL